MLTSLDNLLCLDISVIVGFVKPAKTHTFHPCNSMLGRIMKRDKIIRSANRGWIHEPLSAQEGG